MFQALLWPKVGLITDPRHVWYIGSATAHATYLGSTTAVCGAPTPFLGKGWPHAEDYWTLPYLRCPGCAHRIYALDQHSHPPSDQVPDPCPGRCDQSQPKIH